MAQFHKLIAFALLILLTCSATPPLGFPISVGSAINIAGKQRFLCQRMAKDFMMIGLGVEAATAGNELRASVVLFDENLSILDEFAPNTEIKDAILQIRDLWKPYKTLVASPPTKEGALSVLEQNSAVLLSCEELSKVIKQYAVTMKSPMTQNANIDNEAISEAIQLSGRQRMLSQRMTLFYAAYIWDLPDPSVLTLLRASHEDFKNVLRMLYSSQANNQEIDDALSVVVGEWQAISDLKAVERKEISLTDFFITCNKMMTQLDKVAVLYVKQTE